MLCIRPYLIRPQELLAPLTMMQLNNLEELLAKLSLATEAKQ